MADTEATTSAAPPPTVPFFKKKSKSSGNTATKKRAASPDPSTTAAAAAATTHTSSSSKYDDDDDRGEGPSVVRLAKKEVFNPLKQATSNKRRKQDNNIDDDNDSDYDLEEYSKPTVKYSDRNVSLAIKQKDEEDKILSGEAALAKSGEQTTEGPDDGLYKGKAAYASQLPTGSQKFAPIKGPSSDIRTITLMDYQPDRCKDYAE